MQCGTIVWSGISTTVASVDPHQMAVSAPDLLDKNIGMKVYSCLI